MKIILKYHSSSNVHKLTVNIWLFKKEISPLLSDWDLSWRLLSLQLMSYSLSSCIGNTVLHILWCHCAQYPIKESAFSFQCCSPIIWNVVWKISDSHCITEHGSDSQLRPCRNEDIWNLLSSDDTISTTEDLLHEDQGTSILLWKVHIHMGGQI